MAINYTILKSSIIHSSIWSEEPAVCKVWITMLAMRNKDGEVFGSIGGIAHAAYLSPEITKKAIDKFLAPDPDSASPENDGRRLEEIPGGWRLLSHQRIVEEARRANRANYQANYQAIRRRGKKLGLKGEEEYMAAVKAGADDMQLNAIIDKWLPKKL